MLPPVLYGMLSHMNELGKLWEPSKDNLHEK